MSGTPEYAAWSHMIQRCQNPRTPFYENYGGRGIKVCREWTTFDQFYADMGRRPTPQHSLDRIDNNGHYNPENCRWADARIQQNNRGNCHYLTFNGITQSTTEWEREMGFGRNTIQGRLQRGWSVAEAILTPRKWFRKD
jgi:hypothetical protein